MTRARLAVACAAVATALGAGVATAAGLAGGLAGGGADVTRPAVRGVAFATGETCDLATVEAVAARHPDAGQLVVMATGGFADTTGTVQVATRDAGGRWRCQVGPRQARFGRAGTRPLAERRSGDGTTPAGVFPLGEVTAWDGGTFSMFGNLPDPGVRAAYRAVRNEDCWGATPNTARYQHVVSRPGCTGPDEWLAGIGDVYAHAAVIGANLDPISGDEPGEPPYAAAIFLHRHSYAASGATRATSGCVSLALPDLLDALRVIDPARHPHFAIGPTDWLRTAG